MTRSRPFVERARSWLLFLAIANGIASAGAPLLFHLGVGLLQGVTLSRYAELVGRDVINQPNFKNVSDGHYAGNPYIWIDELLSSWNGIAQFSNYFGLFCGMNAAICFYLWWKTGAELRLARRRAANGQCTSCGYSLTGNTSGTCPECGTPVPKTPAEKSPRTA
jgi:hypothetical protein